MLDLGGKWGQEITDPMDVAIKSLLIRLMLGLHARCPRHNLMNSNLLS